MKCSLSRGFTLVEALIAATIFFATVGVLSEAYRASLAASRKAEITARLLTPLPIIVSHIANHLKDERADEWREQGSVLGVTYEAAATVARRVAPVQRVDPDAGVLVKSGARFKIYAVSIDLAVAGQRRRFQYEELAWLPLEPER